jgi:hypothetical protein
LATAVKPLIFIFFILASYNFCLGQAAKEQKFKAAIKEIVLAFSKRGGFEECNLALKYSQSPDY